METLWLRFSEEASLPASFTAEEKERFESIYNPENARSVWARAAAALGLPQAKGPLLRWHMDVPYVNWSAVVETVSCGWLCVAEKDGGYIYAQRNNLLALPRLLRSQWKIERYVDTRLCAPLPQERDEQLVESTALGLALQAITQRLPKHSEREFAEWLAAPDRAPFTVRKTMAQIRDIQSRRTALSPAWMQVFPPRPARNRAPETPPFFWEEPCPLPHPLPEGEGIVAQSSPSPSGRGRGEGQTEWRGLVVVAGQVTGRAVVVEDIAQFEKPDMADFPILVFPRARPDTVELFPHAAGLLFAEGGTLSHACNVAREQGIPCVTALGSDFFATVRAGAGTEKLWLSMDGAEGSVKVLQAKG